MDFQLKTLTTAQAANDKTDALIVLVAEQPGVEAVAKSSSSAAAPRDDALAALIAQVREAGDLPPDLALLIDRIVDFPDEDAYRRYDLDEEHNRIRRELFAPISSEIRRIQFRLP